MMYNNMNINMKYCNIVALATAILLKLSFSIATTDNDDHPFVRRAQGLPQLPSCGDPPCWCDVTASTSATCPAYPASSIYTFKTEIAAFFESLELMNPDYKDLKLCQPDLSTSINLDGTSVDPNILCEEGILVGGKAAKKAKKSSCMQECKSHPDDAVCGIKFMYDDCKITPDEFDTDCNSDGLATSYIIRTFRNDKRRDKSGYFPFHEGACGVCSTAQDMASFMRHSFPPAITIDTMSFLCQSAIVTNDPGISPQDLVERVSLCLQYGIEGVVGPAGLSPVSSL